VAVVGSDAGVTPEIIGEAGLVVPAGDPPALAAALRRVGAERERRPLIVAGRARVLERFSDVAVAERTVAFWREVIG
jgi:glycosyltransferase involved in cell wall biosynthesis